MVDFFDNLHDTHTHDRSMEWTEDEKWVYVSNIMIYIKKSLFFFLSKFRSIDILKGRGVTLETVATEYSKMEISNGFLLSICGQQIEQILKKKTKNGYKSR